MLFEKLRDLEGTVVLVPDADCEGLEAAVKKKGGMGIKRSAEVVELMRDLRDQFRPTQNNSGNNIRMAVQILGRAVQ